MVIRWLDLGMAATLTQQSVIAGGMLPKLQACKDALLHGVNRVRILPAAEVETTPASDPAQKPKKTVKEGTFAVLVVSE